jgi:hypothetical protein
VKFAEVVSANYFAAHGSVCIVHVDPANLVELAHANSVIRSYAKDEEEGLATHLAELLRFARFRIATSILPIDSVELGLLQIAGQIDEIRSQLPKGTELHHEANRACEALLDLMALPENPLCAKAVELIAEVPEAERLLALANGFYVDATQRHLTNIGIPSKVVAANSLHRLGVVSTLVCIGSPTASLFPEAIWTTPMAESTCFVHYALGWTAPTIEGLFSGGTPLVRPNFIEKGDSKEFSDAEPFDFGESAVEAVARAVSRFAPSGDDDVEAFLIALANGFAVWTEADDRNWMLCVDTDNPEMPVIIKKSARSVSSGDFLVLRSGNSDPDFIRELADSRFGASSERPKQEEWKAALRVGVERLGGLERARDDLAQLGVSTSNLRYWLGLKCISPQKESDFTAICEFSGISSDAAKLWKSMKKIRTAHLKAGQYVRRELEKNLLADGAGRLVDTGYQEYELEGFGQLAAYQVRFISGEKRMISASAIDRPFIAEEGGWPG